MIRSEMILDDSGEVPKPNGVVGGSISNHEIISLLDGKLAKWSNDSCVPNQFFFFLKKKKP